MCLILFKFDPHSETPLIVAANRDEFFARPTAAASTWDDHPQVFAGKDLISGGTWIGVTQTGRFAAVTNVREPHVVIDNPLSRGDLTRDFLSGTQSCEAFMAALEPKKSLYSGFNLLVGELGHGNNQLLYLSNRKDGIVSVEAGTYGLSNHLLNSPWPKASKGRVFLDDALQDDQHTPLHDSLRTFLENPALAEDDALPSTGVSYEREKALSAAFINLPDYGTRTSTVLSVSNRCISFSEKNYPTEGHERQSHSASYIREDIVIERATNNIEALNRSIA